MSSQLPSDRLDPDKRRVVYANSMLELVASPVLREEPHPGHRGLHKVDSVSRRSPFYTPVGEPIPDRVIIGRVDESRARGIFPAIREWAHKLRVSCLRKSRKPQKS
jgi:hypothetical protein